MAKGDVRVRRVYDTAARGDGARVLVDRVWPRGVAKADLPHDEWLREVAPSTELRTWYKHDPDKFAEFRRRYREELAADPGRQALEQLRALTERGTLTLLTATRDVEHSHTAVLAELLTQE